MTATGLVLAYFGINSSALNLVVDLIVVFLAVLYIALIYWTWADARRRIADPMLVGCATAASIFPFVGPIVYMILRPPEYIEDVRERELEMQAAEARISRLDYSLCPHCDYPVEKEFVICPSCLARLRERCTGCSRPLDPAWTICPYCETEAPEPPAPPEPSRSSRRRRSRVEERLSLEEPEDLLGQTVEADSLSLSEEDDDAIAPVPASKPAARTRSSRRSGRPRPGS